MKWQRSTDGAAWDDVSANLDAGTVYSGFTTDTLTLTGSTTSLIGYQYKAVYTNINGSANSNVATLTVVPTPTTANAGADQTGYSTCGLTTVTLNGNNPSI